MYKYKLFKNNSFRPQRILVVAVPCLGDVLLVTPLISSLKKAYPGVSLDLLVRDGTSGTIMENPEINKVHIFDYHSRVFSYLKMMRSIWRKYDLAVSASTSDRATLCSVFAAPYRIGPVPKFRPQDWWKRLVLHGYTELDLNTNTIIQNLRLVDLLGIERSYKVTPPPIKELSDDLRTIIPFNIKTEPYIVVHCFGSQTFKTWPEANWKEVIKYLRQRNIQVLLTGGNAKEEIAALTNLANSFPNQVHNIAAKASFSEATTLLKNALCYVGIDTCMAHIAAAVGIPTISLHGPSDPTVWGPWPSNYAEDTPPFSNSAGLSVEKNVYVIKGNCIGPQPKKCCKYQKPGGAGPCMEKIEADLVIESLKRILSIHNNETILQTTA